MSKLGWYWHRLRAMSSAEMGLRCQKKWHEWVDGLAGPPSVPQPLTVREGFPSPPDLTRAPAELREALVRDLADIQAGSWRAFGGLRLQLEHPPRWQKDHLARVDLQTDRVAFRLNHRALSEGADIKIVWEWSRWHQLARLAMGAYVLSDNQAGQSAVAWLEDWTRWNPPYRGWNWTSALEAGMRLIQFTWMDSWLRHSEGAGLWKKTLDRLTLQIVPAHVQYAWRHRSFGSSANNHLLGELAGLILAQARWPEAAAWSSSLESLQALWQREVLQQFAEDGGHREQALNYHLYSLQLCWLTRWALLATGHLVDTDVEERLARAADFLAVVQVAGERWDYGDSDDAGAIWLGVEEGAAAGEWMKWLDGPQASPSLAYWLGAPPAPATKPGHRLLGDWIQFPESGQLVLWEDPWHLRADVSPLGYLTTAAHGHLDALHLSLWYRGRAMVVDPGTGAYYGDPELRAYLASWDAHNGPHPTGLDFPRRLGPFLWSTQHERPMVEADPDGGWQASLILPQGRVVRKVRQTMNEEGWQVDDGFLPADPSVAPDFVVHWQFAPGSTLETIHDRRFLLRREDACLVVGLDASWSEVEAVLPEGQEKRPRPPWAGQGICSPGFRQVTRGPQLRLRAEVHNPCLFRTTFLASADA